MSRQLLYITFNTRHSRIHQTNKNEYAKTKQHSSHHESQQSVTQTFARFAMPPVTPPLKAGSLSTKCLSRKDTTASQSSLVEDRPSDRRMAPMWKYYK
jgi:hypothetical protein